MTQVVRCTTQTLLALTARVAERLPPGCTLASAIAESESAGDWPRRACSSPVDSPSQQARVACELTLLHEAGLDPTVAIRCGDDGFFEFPLGYVGSFSTNAPAVVAVIVSDVEIRGIGIELVSRQLTGSLASKSGRAARPDLSVESVVSRVAKESVVKAQHAATGCVLAHQSVNLSWAISGREFIAYVDVLGADTLSIYGCIAVADSWVLACSSLARDS